MVAFAVVTAGLLGRMPTWWVLVLAMSAWGAIPVVLYGGQRLVRRVRTRV